jgi:tRNA(Ile)-lysidine synthase
MAKFTRDSIIDLVGSKVEAFNKQYNLFEKTDEILVACSGNADSVFAVHYLIKNKYKIGIAHVDHLTRNGQSTKDANFVENLAKKLNIPFHLKTINIKELISEKGNFQEVARKERYQFFSDIIQSHNYSKILTAHHGDDNVENVLMNLGRAGGIKALRGILPKNNALIRPFLILRKHEILAYLELNELDYTEDSSNSESDYKRNYFRNKVLPVIENKQSNWVDQAMKSAEYMLDIENELNYLANKLLTVNSNLHSISLNALLEQGNPNLYLFFILSSYGFNKAQVDEILKSNKVGKKWENHDYILFKERNCIEFFKKLIITCNSCS